jgi:hypothetical protein
MEFQYKVEHFDGDTWLRHASYRTMEVAELAIEMIWEPHGYILGVDVRIVTD